MSFEYGLRDQIRVDQGKEWYLMLFVQESLAGHRTNSQRSPHLQSSSTQVCKSLLCTMRYNPRCGAVNAW